MKVSTTNNYFKRISRVLEYIVENSDGDLSAETLANVARFSHYHFHRVFKAITAETVGDFVMRIKLEQAALSLRRERLNIDVVSFQSGYETTESFSKAFKKGFGVTPRQYRKLSHYPEYGYSLGRVAFDAGTKRIELTPCNEDFFMQVEIITKPESRYAYISHTGDYNELKDVFDELISWAHSQNIDLETSEIFSQSYDNPAPTPTDELRSEACISISSNVAVSGIIQAAVRRQQKYAVYTHRGSYQGIAAAYQKLLGSWLPSSNLELEIDNCPFIEHYQNDCTTIPEDEWITDLCVPLKG